MELWNWTGSELMKSKSVTVLSLLEKKRLSCVVLTYSII